MTSLQGRTVAVVGAGPAGLAAAYRLSKRGAQVTVFEKQDHVGGRTRSIRKGGFTFDVGALVMLPTYKNAYALIREMGIEPHVHETKPKLAVVRDGQRHSFDYAHPVRSAIGTRLLSWPSKIKLLKLLPVLAKYWSRLNYGSMGDVSELDHESTRDWCLRVLNEEIDDYLANPFIRINSLTDTRRAPIGEWIWQLAAYKSPHIFQLDKGMVFYAESLARSLDVRLNTAVSGLSLEGGEVRLRCESAAGQGEGDYDACILAVPPLSARALAPSLNPAQEKYFSCIEPVGMISAHLGLSSIPQVDDSIVMFPEKESPDLLDILFDHNKGPGRAPPGKAAIAIQSTREWSAAHVHAGDEEIVAKLTQLAEPYVGALNGQVEVALVNRWDYVCAVTFPGYYTLLRDFLDSRNLSQPLFFAGDYFSGGIEGATTSGLAAAADVERYLAPG